MLVASITESQRELHRAHKERISRIEWQKPISPAVTAQGISADQWYSQADGTVERR